MAASRLFLRISPGLAEKEVPEPEGSMKEIVQSVEVTTAGAAELGMLVVVVSAAGDVASLEALVDTDGRWGR